MFSVLQAKLFGQSRYAKWALFSSFAQMILIIALESIVYTMHTSKVAHIEDISVISKDLPKDSYNIVFLNAKSMSVYHILFIISQIFQFVLCVDALYHENTIQLIALSLFSVGILSYSAIQIVQSLNLLSLQSNNSSDSQPIKSIDDHFDELQYPKLSEIPYEVAILIIMTFFACGFAYLAYKLYKEFGWSIYKRIGADMNMRDRYKMYQIFIMLLKLDIFFFVGFTIQFLVIVVIFAGNIWLHITLSTVVSISMIVLAFWGVQTERKLLMYFFMIGCIGTEGYIISKIVDILTNPSKYQGTRIFATFFLFVCLLLGVVTLIISALCLKNFDKGLKFHLSRRNVTSDSVEDISINDPGFNLENRHTKRWSID